MTALISSRRRLVAGLIVLVCALAAAISLVALSARGGAGIDDQHAAHAAGTPGNDQPSIEPSGSPAASPASPGSASPSPGSATPSPTPSPGTGPTPSTSPDARAPELDARPLRAGATALPPAERDQPAVVGQAASGTSLDDAASRPSDAAPLAADGTRTRDLAPAPSVAPSQVLGTSPSTGGCLKEYGSNGQCLPSVPPSQGEHVQSMIAAGQDPSAMSHHYSCAEVRTMFATGVKVRVPGKDPQGLDRDGDGIACGRGDGDD